MPRRARVAPGGVIYHVFNRANGDGRLFSSPVSYRDFLRLVSECAATDRMRVLAYCLMPNHWHFLLWPYEDRDLFRFVHRLTLRHTKRWHSANGTDGRGHLYQARYKSVAVQDDAHLVTACRYVERNPLKAGLVDNAASWPWSSAASRVRAQSPCVRSETSIRDTVRDTVVPLATMPIDLPDDWAAYLNQAPNDRDTDRLRERIRAGLPFGTDEWTRTTAERLGIPLVRNRGGRPRKSDGAGL